MDWLLKNAPGFSALSADERQAIGEFSLLWSLFEGRVMGTRASATAVYAAVSHWNAEGTLDAEVYDPELTYFRERYFDGSNFTGHLEHLHLHAANKPNLVRAVIDGSNNDPILRVGVIHNIVLRFRNNLFHGVKWQYQLQGQLGNFQNASATLMKTLERHGDLSGHV
jgi:hypothetical protein